MCPLGRRHSLKTRRAALCHPAIQEHHPRGSLDAPRQWQGNGILPHPRLPARSEFSTHTLSSVPCRHFQRVLTQRVLTQHVLPGCHRMITWPGCMLQQLRPLPAGPITLRPSQVWAQTGSLHVLWSQTLLERTGLWTWLPGTHEPFCLGQGLCRCDSQIRRDAEANVLRKARWS